MFMTMPSLLESVRDLRTEAHDTARSIALALMENSALVADGSLAGGHGGVALFFAQLYQCEADDRFALRARDHLEAAFERFQPSSGVGLFGGSTGIAWVAQQIARARLVPDATALSDFDDALVDAVERMPDAWTLDLINGAAGVGCYALCREQPAAMAHLVEHLISRLDALRVEQAQGITWRIVHPQSDPQRTEGAGLLNLGVAHGVPGILLFLAGAVRAGVLRASTLLEGAVAWMMKQDGSGNLGARYAHWVSEGSESPSSPVAWCYGDLGVSMAMLQAAQATGRESWRAFALELARNAARHRGAVARVVDAGLCHGAAGNALMFRRWHQTTGLPVFEQASNYWYAQTLEMRHTSEGLAGFRTWMKTPCGPGWRSMPGMLTGAAGIGLALLDLELPRGSGWDMPLGTVIRP
jgi:lantibiotic modifying enzyme